MLREKNISLNKYKGFYDIILLGIVVIFVYFIAHGNFRKESIDDVWHMTWIYYFFNDSVPGHVFRPYPGLLHFFKTQAYIYGPILNMTGWNLSIAHLVSTVFIIASGGVWYFIFSYLNFTKRIAVSCVLLMLLLEPYLFAANLLRADALTFFIASFAFLLFLKEKYLLSGLLCLIGFETHALGLMAFVYIFSYVIFDRSAFLSEKQIIKKFTLFMMGCFLGILYYFMLHCDNLSTLTSMIDQSSVGITTNYIYKYFFQERYFRHFPELIIIIISFYIFLKRKLYKEHTFILIFLVISIASSFIFRRTISLYMIYIFPAILLMIVFTFEKFKKLKWILLIFVLLLLPQYTYVYYQFHDYDLKAYVEKVANSIPDDGLLVLGNPNSWYAFKDREFREYTYTGYADIEEDEFYIIENVTFFQWTGKTAQKERINKQYPSEIIDTFVINNETVNIRYYQKE